MDATAAIAAYAATIAASTATEEEMTKLNKNKGGEIMKNEDETKALLRLIIHRLMAIKDNRDQQISQLYFDVARSVKTIWPDFFKQEETK